MPWDDLAGYVAGIFTTFAVVPQISKAWKTRHVDDISLLMVAVLVCGLALWVAYGVLTQSWPVVITNAISLLLNLFLLGLVFHEKGKGR
ncbi:MAG: hypothetical protein RLZZ227_730 [Pseudomonadota bacterium]|jgi:MtN3 and saliva related transmembrane protein